MGIRNPRNCLRERSQSSRCRIPALLRRANAIQGSRGVTSYKVIFYDLTFTVINYLFTKEWEDRQRNASPVGKSGSSRGHTS